MTLINIRDKCLEKKYKGDYEAVWGDVREALTVQSATIGEASAKWLVFRSFDRIRYRIYYGSEASLINRYKAKLAGDYAEIHRREELHKKLYKKIELDIGKQKLIDIITKEDATHGTSRDNLLNKNNTRKIDNRIETVGGTMVMAEEIPISPIDMLAGEFGDLPKSDRLQVKHSEIQGRREKIEGEFSKDPHGNLYPKYKTMPNVNQTKGSIIDKGTEKSKDIEKGNTHKTTKTQEQPQYAQQIAKIVQSFQMVESDFVRIIESYDCLGFYSTFMPMGGVDFDPEIGKIGYISPERTEEGKAEEAKKVGKKGKEKDDTQQLTEEAYQQLKKAGKPVEKSRVLENLARRKESVKNVTERQNQNIQTLRRGLNGLIEAY